MRTVLGLAMLAATPLWAEEIPATGFYEVHEIAKGRVSEKRGDSLLGKAIYVYQKSYLDAGAATPRVGLAATFEGSGKIVAKPAGNLIWQTVQISKVGNEVNRDTIQGNVSLTAVPGARSDQYLTVIGHPDRGSAKVKSFYLRYAGPKVKVNDTLIVSHRGVSHFPPFNSGGVYPSNSMEAYEEALRQGFDGVEIDVRLTRDKQWVVSHDNKLSLTTDCEGQVYERLLADLEGCTLEKSTLLPEKIAIRAKVTAKMVSLASAMQSLLTDPRAKLLVIDIKPANHASDDVAVNAMLNALNGLPSELSRKLVFVSQTLPLIEKLRPKFPLASFAYEGKTGLGGPYKSDEFFLEPGSDNKRFHDTISLNIGFLSTIFQFPLPKVSIDSYIKKAHKKGYKVIGWTVSSPHGLFMIQRVVDHLDILLTDAPYSRLARLQMDEYY